MDNDDLGQQGNPDDTGYYPGQKPSNIKYIGEDRAVVELKQEPTTHWSQLPKPVSMFPARKYGDNNKSDPEQNWEEEES